MTRLRPHVLASVALAAGVLCFYLWTASDGRAFPMGRTLDGHYDLLAEALCRGQLHLAVEPRPELLQLVDPYDPAKNAPYRLHDASLFGGRYYLYYGVAPALTLFVPWRLLGLGDLPESLATAVFAFGAFTFAGLLLGRLTNATAPTTPLRPRLAALLVLALTNGMPFLLRGAAVYEVAISAGACFLLGSAWAFATAAERGPVRIGRLALASLLLGLAVGSRPSHVFSVPLLLALAVVTTGGVPARRFRAAAAAILPLAACLLLLAAYNLARFGSPFEFGTRYQLSGNHPHGLLWFDARGILPGLYFNFLAPPSLRLDFPFVFLERRYPGTLPPGYFGPELIAGVLWLAPFVLLLLALPRILRSGEGPATPARVAVALLAAVGLLNPTVTSFLIGAANQRYEGDFVSFLVVPALVAWLTLRARWAEGPRVRRLLAWGTGLSLAWACAAGLALSLTGYEDSLRQGNPGLFRALERRFEPLRVLVGRLLVHDARLTLRFRAAFPERPAAESEPLVGSGSPQSQDVVFVRTTDPGLVSFSVRHADEAERMSKPVRVRPGHFYAIEVEMDRVRRRVGVRLDGAEVARIETPLGPLVRGRIWLGRGARGKDAPGLGRFSGAIVSEAMDWALPKGGDRLPELESSPVFLGDGTSPPPTGAPGQLWASTARDGAFVFDGARWRWIARFFLDRLAVSRTVVFAASHRDEPLVVSGDASSADLVLVRTEGPGRIAFAYRRWPAPALTVGPARPLTPGPHRIEVLLDRPANRLRVSLDGETALEVTADLLPIEKAGLAIGRVPKGLTLEPAVFAGTLGPAPE